MAKIQRLRFLVELPERPVLDITATYGDQLRGEMEAAKRGLSREKHPVAYMTCCVWAALVRLGHVDVNYAAFESSEFESHPVPYDVELTPGQPVPDVDPDEEDGAVPPTGAGPSGSASISPLPTPAPTSAGGWPPPSTTID